MIQTSPGQQESTPHIPQAELGGIIAWVQLAEIIAEHVGFVKFSGSTNISCEILFLVSVEMILFLWYLFSKVKFIFYVECL